ncbi:MAG: heme ABC exporter ATP-binding protein CcmA [Acidimicrobiia bacterium]|nr:heme ABC exporter ATP-binding protein CcmA [Acidimicrobiia bacterium]NNC42723.1 heme ABC exporter ATP-binding protein CcmA [Acidimicrobiia bacterium]NNL28563.1 heme ABC exporter ATP-binding protein CcmA [Acidimicrobiia bacterium]
MAPTSHLAIDARVLMLQLGNTPVLANVSFELAEGTAIGITGANGSGKSSLLRCLATLQRPTVGYLNILGRNALAAERRSARRDIALIGHDSGLYPTLTLRENLKLVADMLGRSTDRVDQALDAVGLRGAAERPFAAASKGMVRRLELARVLIQQPRLLLLDEAHAGLDAASSDLVDQVVSRVTVGGGSAVVVSHEIDRLRPTVDQLYVIERGILEIMT